MKTKITISTLIPIFLICLTLSCNKKEEPVEEIKIILSDHIIRSGTLWFLEKVLETGLDTIAKDFDSILHITVRLTDTSVSILKDDSIVLARSYYKELHHYITDDDSLDLRLIYNPSEKQRPTHPKTSRELKPTEMKHVILYSAYGLERVIDRAYYHTVFRMPLFNTRGGMAHQVKPGDTVYAFSTSMIGPSIVTESKEKIPITSESKTLAFSMVDLELRPVALMDVLDYHLNQINVAYIYLNRENIKEDEIPKYRVNLIVEENVTEGVKKQVEYCLKDKDFIEF